MKTRAAVLWERNTPWSIEEVELDAPRAHEVLVRLESSGMCHSDDHVLKGDLPARVPLIGGHEGAGVVEAVGPEVAGLREGDHVVLAFIPACGHCRWCSSGRQNLCDVGAGLMEGLPISDGVPRAHARGQGLSAMSLLGTFTRHTVVHEYSCVKIDPDIPLKYASLVGCGVTTGFGSAINRAQVQPGDTVVVVGTGGVGASAVQAARIAGAEIIVAVDSVEFRRDAAKALGATHTASSMEEALPLVADLTRGVMADRTILTVGLMIGSMIAELLALTRKGGRACLTSAPSSTEVKADLVLLDFIMSEKELVGAVYGGSNPAADIPKLLRLYKSGQLKLGEMVTRTYSLDEINDGYVDTLSGSILRGLITFD
jgi:NDMA-dependent alcohol dehydrogenase